MRVNSAGQMVPSLWFVREEVNILRGQRSLPEATWWVLKVLDLHQQPGNSLRLNLAYAEATFVQSTRIQRFLITLSCWYLLESSHLVLSDEYPYARVSVIFQFFSHHFVLAKLATSSIRDNYKAPMLA